MTLLLQSWNSCLTFQFIVVTHLSNSDGISTNNLLSLPIWSPD